MSRKLGVAGFLVTLILSVNFAGAAENKNYPPPRFPSYVRPPKSIEDVMPFARAAVRQTGGRTPLGLVEQGADGGDLYRTRGRGDGDAGDQARLRGARREDPDRA